MNKGIKTGILVLTVAAGSYIAYRLGPTEEPIEANEPVAEVPTQAKEETEAEEGAEKENAKPIELEDIVDMRAQRAQDYNALSQQRHNIPLNRLNNWHCNVIYEQDHLLMEFDSKDMKEHWGGVIYNTDLNNVDVSQYRFLHLKLKAENIDQLRVEAQSSKKKLGVTFRKRIILENGVYEGRIDLDKMLKQWSWEDNSLKDIAELKLIVEKYSVGNGYADFLKGSIQLYEMMLE
ncbi:MAG: hypothetical protein V3V78_04195 [Candidatus Woesearchaeota archaeon]